MSIKLRIISSAVVIVLAMCLSSTVAFASSGGAEKGLTPASANGMASKAQISAQAVVAKASAFKYKEGQYIDYDGKVYASECWYGKRKVKNKVVKHIKGYACEFKSSTAVSIRNGRLKTGSVGYNCGKGIYIIGYKGPKNANVVVPNKIAGKPVVYADFSGVALKRLNVSKCKHLKALTFGGYGKGRRTEIGSVVFGANKTLSTLAVSNTHIEKKVISPKNVKYISFGESSEIHDIVLPTKKLQYLYLSGGNFLRLGTFPQLRTMYLDFCWVEDLAASKMPNLKTIIGTGTMSQETMKALKKWQKAKKGRMLNFVLTY